MTIAEVAQSILQDTGKPMNVNDIYQEIISRNLYSFGAKNPKGVLAQAIHERSDANPKAKSVIFCKVSQGTYKLA